MSKVSLCGWVGQEGGCRDGGLIRWGLWWFSSFHNTIEMVIEIS